MNDYWNDPPEQWEQPECCDELMNVTPRGACVCSICGKVIEPEPDIEPIEELDITDDTPSAASSSEAPFPGQQESPS